MTEAPHIPTASEGLAPGRTDVLIGDLVVGWIEWFQHQHMAEVHFEIPDGRKSVLMSGYTRRCVDVIRQWLPTTNRPVLKVRHRPGSERTWAEAHPEESNGGTPP